MYKVNTRRLYRVLNYLDKISAETDITVEDGRIVFKLLSPDQTNYTEVKLDYEEKLREPEDHEPFRLNIKKTKKVLRTLDKKKDLKLITDQGKYEIVQIPKMITLPKMVYELKQEPNIGEPSTKITLDSAELVNGVKDALSLADDGDEILLSYKDEKLNVIYDDKPSSYKTSIDVDNFSGGSSKCMFSANLLQNCLEKVDRVVSEVDLYIEEGKPLLIKGSNTYMSVHQFIAPRITP